MGVIHVRAATEAGGTSGDMRRIPLQLAFVDHATGLPVSLDALYLTVMDLDGERARRHTRAGCPHATRRPLPARSCARLR